MLPSGSFHGACLRHKLPVGPYSLRSPSLVRAIFRDWFVDFGPTRAKADGRSAYLATGVWNMFPDALDDAGKPEGWKEGTLADVADLNPPRPSVVKHVHGSHITEGDGRG